MVTCPVIAGNMATEAVVDLSRNLLKGIPSHETSFLASVVYLDLSHNVITVFYADVIRQLMSIRTLYLRSNLLQALPHEIFLLPSLKSLTLGDNQLSCQCGGNDDYDRYTSFVKMDIIVDLAEIRCVNGHNSRKFNSAYDCLVSQTNITARMSTMLHLENSVKHVIRSKYTILLVLAAMIAVGLVLSAIVVTWSLRRQAADRARGLEDARIDVLVVEADRTWI